MTMPFTWSAEIAARAAALDAEVEALRSRPLTPAALRSLIAWLRLQHVYNSNAIEGNTLTLSETKVIVEDGLTVGGKSLREHAEAVNLAAAVDYILGLARAEDPPVDAALIRNLHLLVLRDINRDEAGRYRQEPVRISGSSYPTTEPLHLEEAMIEFDEWLTTEPEPRNAVLRAAIGHTWLVNIHAFIDGNGRVARLTMNILLLRAGYPLATIRKEDRPRYYDALERSHAGDLSEWVTLLAERVTDSIREYRRAQDEAERAEGLVTSLSQRYRETQAGPPPDYLMWKGTVESFLDEVEVLVRAFNARVSREDQAQPLALVRRPLTQQVWQEAWLGPLSFPELAQIRVGTRTITLTAGSPSQPLFSAGGRTTTVIVNPPGRRELLRWHVAIPTQGRFLVLRGGAEQHAGPMGQRTVLAGAAVQGDITPAMLAQELIEDLVRHFLA